MRSTGPLLVNIILYNLLVNSNIIILICMHESNAMILLAFAVHLLWANKEHRPQLDQPAFYSLLSLANRQYTALFDRKGYLIEHKPFQRLLLESDKLLVNITRHSLPAGLYDYSSVVVSRRYF